MATLRDFLGDLEFKFIKFDSRQLGDALRDFITVGSNVGTLTIDDLTVIRRVGQDGVPFKTVREALDNGTRLFDALAYFSLPEDKRPIVKVRPLRSGSKDPTLDEISKALFFVYVWIMTRGSPPPLEQPAEGWAVPAMLSKLYRLNKEPPYYASLLATFDLGLIESTWIKYIPTTDLHVIPRNRLSLGLAGYRLASALTQLNLKPDADKRALRAANAVRKFVNRGLVWDCHAVTRSSSFPKHFNENLENIIVECVAEDDIKEAVRLKILAKQPVKHNDKIAYLSWTWKDFVQFKDFIFKDDEERYQKYILDLAKQGLTEEDDITESEEETDESEIEQ